MKRRPPHSPKIQQNQQQKGQPKHVPKQQPGPTKKQCVVQSSAPSLGGSPWRCEEIPYGQAGPQTNAHKQPIQFDSTCLYAGRSGACSMQHRLFNHPQPPICYNLLYKNYIKFSVHTKASSINHNLIRRSANLSGHLKPQCFKHRYFTSLASINQYRTQPVYSYCKI